MPFKLDPVTQSNSRTHSTHPPHLAWSLRGIHHKRHVAGTLTVQPAVWWAIARTHCFVKDYTLYSLVLADFSFFNQIIKWKGVQFILLINIFHRSASDRKIHQRLCTFLSPTMNSKSSLTGWMQINSAHLVTIALQRRPLFQAAFQGQDFG